jgi:TPR repeat protein
MDALASAYERGVGVTPDYDKALDWYRRAAQCGHNGALKRLRKLGELV